MDRQPPDGAGEEERDDEPATPSGGDAHRSGHELAHQGGDQAAHRQAAERETGDLILTEGEGSDRPQAEEADDQAPDGRADQSRHRANKAMSEADEDSEDHDDGRADRPCQGGPAQVGGGADFGRRASRSPARTVALQEEEDGEADRRPTEGRA